MPARTASSAPSMVSWSVTASTWMPAAAAFFHQRRRRILPIRRGGVGVEVCQDGHAFISLRMATIRITGGSSFP